MTGFARVRGEIAAGEVVLSLKSLNHRGLDLHIHAPSEFDPFENGIRSAVKRKVIRGHVDVRISLTRTGRSGTVAHNAVLLDAYVQAFREATKQYGLIAEPDINFALQLPGMFVEGAPAESESGVEAALLEMLERALDELNEFRAREGEEIQRVLLERNAAIRAAATRLEQIRSRAVPAYQARLNERIAELLKSAGLEPQRLAQEAAILADRSDVGEEIARLKIHAGQLESLLRSGGEVGKKLDFLLQEMNRESNTILSKTTGIGETGVEITDVALGLKADIEKIREQALNIE
jgi:uncharacterized protein (TIGR00255 family)